MSDLQKTATAIWDRLVTAMRLDGMIANAITSTGPQTTQVVLQLAQDNLMHEADTLWVPIAIQPSKHAQIWGRNFDKPEQRGVVIEWSDLYGAWVCMHNGVPHMPPQITHYILLPDIGKALQPYVKPQVKPEPEVL